MSKTLCVALVFGVIGTAQAATISLWNGTGKNPGDTETIFDDTYVHRVGTAAANDYSAGAILSLQTGFGPNPVKYVLIGIKELFTVLPATSGGSPILISNATLTLSTNTFADGPVAVATLVTPWLLKGAGISESNVNGLYSDVGASTTWAAGNFSTADVDMTGSTTLSVPAMNGGLNDFDVTTIVANMYADTVNNGFVLWGTEFNNVPKFNSTESASIWTHPKLTIDYTFLTPGDANGDGSVDLQDFGLLKDNFGTTSGALWAQGDFNGDGAVDLQDFGLLKDNFGAGGAAVPEPATLSLLAIAGIGLLRRKRS